MPRKRVSSTTGRSNTRRTRSHRKLKSHRFIGVGLGGGKNDQTSVAILEYFPSQEKVFLTHIYQSIKQEGNLSSDQILFDIIKEHVKGTEYLCLDAPLKFPKCIRCRLKCPGYEKCKEKEIQWMWKQRAKLKKTRKRIKLFTPYTQRAAEIYLSQQFGSQLTPQETMGANISPLTARAHFLVRRFPKLKAIETFPKLSVFRLGQQLKVSKSHLLHYRHLVGGDESRQTIMQELVNQDLAFIYHQDFVKLIDNLNSFDAFIAAYTGLLKYQGLCEKPPKDFPIADGWIEFPA